MNQEKSNTHRRNQTAKKDKRSSPSTPSNSEKPSRKRQCRSYTFGEKQALLKKFNEGSSNQALFASNHNIPMATFSRWLKDQDHIIHQAEDVVLKDSMRHRSAKYPALESALFRWFQALRAAGSTMTDELLKAKAKQLSTSSQSGVTDVDWHPSNGFLYRFKVRHGIRSCSQTGELLSANEEDAESERLRIQRLILDTPLEEQYNIFINQDETGLYWRCLPMKSLSASTSNHGAKRSKDRITIAIFSSSDGSIFDPFIIGKSANPQCFRGQQNTNIPLRDRYMNSKKAWMTLHLCRQIIQKFQAILEVKAPGAKPLIFWDNASSHPPELAQQKEHCFFAPNLTSIVQPNDQGIIAAFKLAYRREFLKRLVGEVEQTILEYRNQGLDIPRDLATLIANKFTLKDALECIHIATNYMRENPSIAQNCWLKAGILPISSVPISPASTSGISTISATTSDTISSDVLDDPTSSIRQLAAEVDRLLGVVPENERLTLREYVDLDSELQTEEPPELFDDSDETRWFYDLIQNDETLSLDDSNSDSVTIQVPSPSCVEIIQAVDCLLRVEDLSIDLKTQLLSLKYATSQRQDQLLRQTRIDDFFKGIPADLD